MSYTYKYPRPAVTADVVAITSTSSGQVQEEEPKVLLIQRGNEPYKGHWAFPGGFMEMDETTEECDSFRSKILDELKVLTDSTAKWQDKIHSNACGRHLCPSILRR